ncbi:hypothetical protein ACFL6H_04055 [Candidatus Latescibacterota bacterium]
MIELKGIAAYNNNYKHKSGANRKNKNDGLEFSLQNGSETESSSESLNVQDVKEKTKIKETIIKPETDVKTYNFWGKILNTDLLFGVNIDIVI